MDVLTFNIVWALKLQNILHLCKDHGKMTEKDRQDKIKRSRQKIHEGSKYRVQVIEIKQLKSKY